MKRKQKQLSQRHVYVAGKISRVILKLQQSWTGFLDRHINRKSPRAKKIGFGIWVIGMSAVCAALILKPFSGNLDPPVFHTGNISVPVLPQSPASSAQHLLEADSALGRFKKFRDSLKARGGEEWQRFLQMYPDN